MEHVCYSVRNKQKPSTIPSRKFNNCVWSSLVRLVAYTTERKRNVKTEKFKLEPDKFLELIPDEPKMPNYVTASRSNGIPDQLFHRNRKQHHLRPSHSSEGSRNLPKWWSPRLGRGAGWVASKPLQVCSCRNNETQAYILLRDWDLIASCRSCASRCCSLCASLCVACRVLYGQLMSWSKLI